MVLYEILWYIMGNKNKEEEQYAVQAYENFNHRG